MNEVEIINLTRCDWEELEELEKYIQFVLSYEKVEHVFPGYKESISTKASKAYASVKNLVVSTYLDITSSICENHSDLCESAKSDFQSLKESFGFTWDFLKELASSGLDKLKNWYEIWSGK